MDTKKLKPALGIAILSLGLAIYIANTGYVTKASIWSLFPPLMAIL